MTERQVERAHLAWVAEVTGGRSAAHGTLGTYLKRWLAQRAADMKPQTHERHAVNVGILTRHASALRLASLDALTVTEILASATRVDGQPLSTASRRSLRATLSVALGDAVRWRLISTSPVGAARLPRTIPTERAVPTTEQVHALISAEMTAHREHVAALAAERQRLLIELHDAHGWSDARIARALNVHRTAVQKARQGR